MIFASSSSLLQRFLFPLRLIIMRASVQNRPTTKESQLILNAAVQLSNSSLTVVFPGWPAARRHSIKRSRRRRQSSLSLQILLLIEVIAVINHAPRVQEFQSTTIITTTTLSYPHESTTPIARQRQFGNRRAFYYVY